MTRDLIHLQAERNRRKADAEPSAVIRGPRTPTEERMDAQLERMLLLIDEQQDRIETLERRQLQLTAALNELLSRLEEV